MRPPERTRVRVSPGAPALLAVFVWLSSPEVLGAVLLAALCHELGHYAVLRSRGGWVRHMEISALGANMQVAGRLSYGSELLALCWRTDPFLADRMAGGVSLAAAGLLTAAGAALAGRSPFLLMTAVCLLCCTAGPCIKRRKSVYASGKREASA